jgi:N-acetylneuraminic acid mutarotase
MVPTVEIYDPRLDAWRMGDPMHTPRGYAAAVNLDDSLFLIGGMQSNVQLLDTVSNHALISDKVLYLLL